MKNDEFFFTTLVHNKDVLKIPWGAKCNLFATNQMYSAPSVLHLCHRAIQCCSTHMGEWVRIVIQELRFVIQVCMCVYNISPGEGKGKPKQETLGRHFFSHSASINTCEISKVPLSDKVCSEREQKKQDLTLQTGNLKAYLGKKKWLPTEVLHNQKF